MKWKKRVEEELKSYMGLRLGLGVLEQRAALSDGDEEVKRAFELAKTRVKAVDLALAQMTRDECTMIEHFYFYPQPNAERMAIMTGQLGCEMAQVYRVRGRALKKAACVIFGVTEL